MGFDDVLESMRKSMDKELDQTRHIFSLTNSISASIAKTAGYILQINSILKRIEQLMQAYRINKNSKLSTAIMNNILIELQYLKVASRDLNNNLEEIRRQQGVQLEVSGKLIGLRNDVEKAIHKAEMILSTV